MHPARQKSQEELSNEWDSIALARHEQIASGRDISFHHVLLPCILDLLAKASTLNVLDVGCGTGYLSSQIAQRSTFVTGIDPSRISIDLATKTYSPSESNLRFLNTSIEDFAVLEKRGQYTAIVANMVLMDVRNVELVAASVAKLLAPKGRFIATITHPCFWPIYWGYSESDWFDYSKEIAIEAPFAISNDHSIQMTTTHIHRPIEMYSSALSRAGLLIAELIEPKPTDAIQSLYPEKWAYPRFLGFGCKKSD